MSTTLYLLACGVLFYGGFCRLVHTDVSTVLCIRAAFWLLTVAAVLSAAAVLLWGYAPGWPAAILAGSMAGVRVLAGSVIGIPCCEHSRQLVSNPVQRLLDRCAVQHLAGVVVDDAHGDIPAPRLNSQHHPAVGRQVD